MISFFHEEIVESSFYWIAQLGQGKVQLGGQVNDGWAIKINGKILFIKEKEDCTFILPILESNRKLFFDSLKNYPAAFRQASGFPESLLLSNAFSYPGSDYWASKALAWINDDWREINQLEKIITSVSAQKNWSQRVRHDFRKLQRKFDQGI